MTYTIEAEALTKRFGRTQGLRGIDLTAGPGTVLALLGPNGAGKTTAVRVLATLLKADSGQARICGCDVVTDAVQVRQLIALTGQFASVDDELTGTENMMMIGRLLGFSRARSRARAVELLERFGLAGAAGRPAKTYSGGMRRRLDLAASLIGQPQVLFLDEPTTGLDPRARSQVWETIRGPPSRTGRPASSRTFSGPRMPIRTVLPPAAIVPVPSGCVGWQWGASVSLRTKEWDSEAGGVHPLSQRRPWR
jgi:oleandomycin transport system ATP-binding protein